MDGFFWINEGSTASNGSNGNGNGKGDTNTRKVKERDIELTFTQLPQSKVTDDEKKEVLTNEEGKTSKEDNQQLHLAVHGRGCNEFGSFIINGEYKVTKSNDNKLHNKLICKKCYSDDEQDKKPQRGSTHCTLVP